MLIATAHRPARAALQGSAGHGNFKPREWNRFLCRTLISNNSRSTVRITSTIFLSLTAFTGTLNAFLHVDARLRCKYCRWSTASPGSPKPRRTRPRKYEHSE